MKYTRVYADINLDNIKENVKNLMAAAAPGTKAMAVVKADAYGHGDVAVAKALEPVVEAYAVATAEEALNLRENGIDKMILILGYVDENHFESVINSGISIPLFDIEMAEKLSAAAVKLKRKAKCHIKVDTGMRRIGLEPDEGGKAVVMEASRLQGIEIEGIFTHFAYADERDKTNAYIQLKKFRTFVDSLESEGITFKYRHCSNSAGVIDMPEANMDMVRLGIAMYGMYPSGEVIKQNVKLYPAIELKSFVTMVKTIQAGERVSYNGTYTAKRPTVIATVETGYGDGYPRNLSNKGYVLIHGQKAFITGRVCMDQFMVDVTDIPGVCRGDMVTLIGNDGQNNISVEEMAEMAGTFNYEFVCGLGKRIPRNYYLNNRYIGSRDYFTEKWNIKFHM